MPLKQSLYKSYDFYTKVCSLANVKMLSKGQVETCWQHGLSISTDSNSLSEGLLSCYIHQDHTLPRGA